MKAVCVLKNIFATNFVIGLILILSSCDQPTTETRPDTQIHTVVPPLSQTCDSPVEGIKISGTVTSGGYVGPSGLSDAPKKFEHQVETGEGETYTIRYTAFPPGPVDRTGEIRLKFHAGEILIGDYLIACGTLDLDGQVVIVDKAGQFIETYPHKP